MSSDQESHHLRRFQLEDEDEALTKALKNSQQDKPASSYPLRDTEVRYGSSLKQPSRTNLVQYHIFFFAFILQGSSV